MSDLLHRANNWRRYLTRRAGVALGALGIVVERTAKSESFPALLQRRLQAVRADGKAFYFVQIGANDGQSHDPIHAFVCANRLQGLVVEPLPDVFPKLCATYAGQPQIKPVNVAIHSELDRVTLFRPNTGGEMSGIASLDAKRHEFTSKRTGMTESDIVSVEVPAISLMGLLEQEQVQHIDLLQIDTEGYDLEILKSLDLTRFAPSIVRFEHGVYSGVPVRDELREALLRFYDHGYSVAMERVDAVAWRYADIAKRKRR